MESGRGLSRMYGRSNVKAAKNSLRPFAPVCEVLPEIVDPTANVFIIRETISGK